MLAAFARCLGLRAPGLGACHFSVFYLRALRLAVLAALLGWVGPVQASGLDGAQLSLWWGLPFAGMLLSIAIGPLVAPLLWHHHFGKLTAVWALAFLLPFAALLGVNTAAAGVAHALLAEYVPFILLLTALFTVSGGIYIRGHLRGTPLLNTVVLFVGGVLASFMGTTGASMLLIRPLIRANDYRRRSVHVYVFFIFIVSNIGGALTPLGDPPLFLGFLEGVDFFWTLRHVLSATIFMLGALLVLFYLLDTWLYRQEAAPQPVAAPEATGFGFDGGINFALLVVVLALVMMSGMWRPGDAFSVLGTHVPLSGLLRDVGLVVVTLASLALTPARVHADNQFGWAPMKEVAKLFAGIFITIIPVLAMLQAGERGPFGAVVRAVTDENGQPIAAMYFWATGTLSAFLDNAPTYLVFFSTAGGDATQLMGPLSRTLMAISAGAVFMGAMTYIGNAPNLMVKAIAQDRGVCMPSFFGYMAWSFGILGPLLVGLTLLFFV